MRRCVVLLLLSLSVASCTSIRNMPSIERLALYMEGNYSSTAQAKEDSSNYMDIRLHIKRVWNDRPDGYWFYVEQAQGDHQNKPYRQRFYHLYRRDDGKFVSETYLVENPMRIAGAWQDPSLLNVIHPELLSRRDGCSVVLSEDGEGFSGATEGARCPGDLRTAVYVTSEVTISREMLTSWDRGFDDNGKQVWGAVKGAYRFVKE